MSNYRALSEEEIAAALAQLPDWRVVAGKLHREYKFPSFSAAFGFMAAAAIEADKLDHHPEWSNVYSRVVVDLVTHDLGNVISDRDAELAGIMEKLAAGSQPKDQTAR